MPLQNKYPRRSEYSNFIGEGRNFYFQAPAVCVSVAWHGNNYSVGNYRITLAFITDRENAKKFPNYPFIKTKRDKETVDRWLQKSCQHEWDYFNYHAVCINCQFVLQGDFREIVLREQGVDQVDRNDDYISEKYGQKGLALRRARAGAEGKGEDY